MGGDSSRELFGGSYANDDESFASKNSDASFISVGIIPAVDLQTGGAFTDPLDPSAVGEVTVLPIRTPPRTQRKLRLQMRKLCTLMLSHTDSPLLLPPTLTPYRKAWRSGWLRISWA
jgi:hypothetical protein